MSIGISVHACLGKDTSHNIETMALAKTHNKISLVLVGHNDSNAPR